MLYNRISFTENEFESLQSYLEQFITYDKAYDASLKYFIELFDPKPKKMIIREFAFYNYPINETSVVYGCGTYLDPIYYLTLIKNYINVTFISDDATYKLDGLQRDEYVPDIAKSNLEVSNIMYNFFANIAQEQKINIIYKFHVIRITSYSWKNDETKNFMKYIAKNYTLNDKPLLYKKDTTILCDNFKHVPEYILNIKNIQNNINIITYNNDNKILETIVNIFLLSKCTNFICNRISTYSDLVFWFSRCSQNVYPLF